jgi:uncharacterized membrane protein HdeD (DUF308 family)
MTSRSRPPESLIVSGAVIGLIIAGVAASISFFGSDPPNEIMDERWGGVSWGAVAAFPSLLALLSLRERSSLRLVAGVMACLMAFALFSVVTLPLLIPGIMFLVAYTASHPDRPRVPSVLSGVVLIALVLGAVAATISSEDPRCWSYVERSGIKTYRVEEYTGSLGGSGSVGGGSRGSGCSSDMVVPSEALSGLAILAFALGAAYVMSGPRTTQMEPAATN